jgi:hypothetical protein
MKRALLSATALFAVLMIGPGAAMAHKGTSHHRAKRVEAKHHARKHHDARVRIRDFGSTSPAGTASSSDNAGTVKSFMHGTLIITVDGSDVSGTVTPSTKLECESAPAVVTATMSKDGDGQRGDDNPGPRGDDNDQAEDQNDVNDENDDNDVKADCTMADLTAGAVVREAVLRVSGAGSTWEKVELVK